MKRYSTPKRLSLRPSPVRHSPRPSHLVTYGLEDRGSTSRVRSTDTLVSRGSRTRRVQTVSSTSRRKPDTLEDSKFYNHYLSSLSCFVCLFVASGCLDHPPSPSFPLPMLTPGDTIASPESQNVYCLRPHPSTVGRTLKSRPE